jgi:hypothetical protein
MFAATPRLRDLLDLRTVLLVAAVALVAFGLQLGFLAGTVASPLGEAIANLETIPPFQTTPAGQALAGADEGRDPRPAIAGDAHLPWERQALLGAQSRPVEQACLVYR